MEPNLGTRIDVARTTISGAAGAVAEKIVGTTTAVGGKIAETAGKAGTATTEATKAIPGTLLSGVNSAGEHIGQIPGTLGDMARSVAEPVGQAASFTGDTIARTGGAINDMATSGVDKTRQAVQYSSNKVGDAAGVATDAIGAGVDRAGQTLNNAGVKIGETANGIRENLGDTAESVKERTKLIFENAGEYVKGADTMTKPEAVGIFLEDLKRIDGKSMTPEQRVEALAALEVGKGVMLVELIKTGEPIIAITKKLNPEKAAFFDKAIGVIRQVQAVNDLVEKILGRRVIYDQKLHESARDAALKFYLSGSSEKRPWTNRIPGKRTYDDVFFAIDIVKHVGKDIFGKDAEKITSDQIDDHPEDGIIAGIEAEDRDAQIATEQPTEPPSSPTESPIQSPVPPSVS